MIFQRKAKEDTSMDNYMDKFAKRREFSDYIYDKLMETGDIRKCDAKRAANAVARNEIQSIKELQKIMEEKNWYKNYRQIGKRSADILEKVFKDAKVETTKTTIDRIELGKAIKGVAQWWNDFLPMLLMEECAELQQAVSKFERYWATDVTSESRERKLKGDITKEMADVFITILAYCEYYGIEPNDIFKATEEKLRKKYDKVSQ
jgi:NTP pyrophosphatase (non-canonical NTP hydrolase)